MITVEDINFKLVEKYEEIKEGILKKIQEDGMIKTAERYIKIFTEKVKYINEEYQMALDNKYQMQIPYQKYILLINSRVLNIGPLHKNNPDYNKDWLVEMMSECHFAYYCYCLERSNLAAGILSNDYEECMRILNR